MYESLYPARAHRFPDHGLCYDRTWFEHAANSKARRLARAPTRPSSPTWARRSTRPAVPSVAETQDPLFRRAFFPGLYGRFGLGEAGADLFRGGRIVGPPRTQSRQ